MTNIQKAIEHFKYGINCDIFSEPVRSYAKMAVLALEKQIPKKPKTSRSTIGIMWGKKIKTKHFACPFCKSIFLFARDELKGNCCKFCGQAISWESEER